MKNKICIVGPGVRLGGIERASATIANFFSNEGKEVMYFAIFKQPRHFDLKKEIIYSEPQDGSNKKSLDFWTTIKRIRREILQFNPDVVLGFNKFYCALTVLSLIGTSYRVFISERSSPFFRWPFKIRIINRIAFFIKKPAGIIAQTEVAADFQKKYYGKKIPIRVIPNPVRDIKLFPEIKRKKQILAVGRMNDHLKGFDRLLEAFALIKTDWNLVFAGGDINEGQELYQQACDLGIESRVRFLGRVKDLDNVYAESGIFVIPSRSEGFPNALVEAMAAGLPCIAFDFVAGPREIISNGLDGLIVENGNIKALSEGLKHLILNPEERIKLGQNALQIRGKLNLRNIGRQYLEFISSKAL